SYNFNLLAEGLMRLSQRAVAPYVGAGFGYVHTRSHTEGTNEVSVLNQTTHVDNRSTTQTLSLRGLVGAEWRIHENFAFYAEYGVSLALWRYTSTKNETVVENTVGDVRTAQRSISRVSAPRWFNWSTGLDQGAN